MVLKGRNNLGQLRALGLRCVGSSSFDIDPCLSLQFDSSLCLWILFHCKFRGLSFRLGLYFGHVHYIWKFIMNFGLFIHEVCFGG